MAYEPLPFGQFKTLDEVARYLQDELNRVAGSLHFVEEGFRVVFYVAPKKPRVGMVVYADGASWNPGGGAGSYEYTGAGATGWRQLANGTQY